ncbi:hypothetical protein [Rhizobium terrae]|uniref:hypothetical protein n=1 Tax=Rhizobium terrae TaxID=2171756 RepID=UPI000E3E6335|nr:hypothetical protein [Rhizobium terrae]
MNASGEFLVSDQPPTLFGQRLCDLGWNAALGLAEGMISLRGNRTTLSFFDERSILRQALDLGYRDQLSRRLLLPGGGRAFGLLARLLRPQSPSVRYAAKTFIPSLLTFLERKHRIGIAGEDAGRIEALSEHLARHAPWHEVVAIHPDQEISRRFDLVIVDAKNLAQERRIERRLSSVRTGLVVMAGSGLSAIMPEKPAHHAPKARIGSPRPSFA